jgi:dTDP-4-dehydrorhamnose 3,5-epimerase
VQIRRFSVEGPVLFVPRVFGDHRGFFLETFRQDLFEREAGPAAFVQDNHSFSAKRGTLRGLHYQKAPMAQGKLVRVTRGAVLDVAVDIRPGSPSYGRSIAVELLALDPAMLWIPPGFLHGFCTLVDDTDFLYKVTQYYSAADDGAVIWNDPDLDIAWPFPAAELTISDKDRAAPRLRDLPADIGGETSSGH